MRWLWLALVLSACGGGAVAPPEEEVTATWTSGDDAPLEDEPLEDEQGAR